MDNVFQRIGVIGAGLMGRGIAQVCAAAGYQTTLIDLQTSALDFAQRQITLSLEKAVATEEISQTEKKQTIANLSFATELQRLAVVDLVIEAIPENEEAKKELYQALTSHISLQALLATNTSSLSITRLAAATDRPTRFIGLHFMNPVPLMPLIEVIRGFQTDDTTLEKACDFAETLDKVVIQSQDSPGFIVNRLIIPMINEAIFALQENIATVEDIDAALRFGAHHPMGPLELADLIGLDTCYAIMKSLYEGFGDDKYRPCPLLSQYISAGWLGRKTQKGFYDYSANEA